MYRLKQSAANAMLGSELHCLANQKVSFESPEDTCTFQNWVFAYVGPNKKTGLYADGKNKCQVI